MAEYLEHEALIKRNEKKSYNRAWLPINLAVAGIAIHSALSWNNLDIAANQKEAAESQPTITSISEEYDTGVHKSSVFYLAGFDTPNGDVFAKKVGVAIHQVIPGEDESVNYGNAPLEASEIAKKIIQAAEENGVTRISIVGNSVGGLIASEVAVYIVEHSFLELEGIVLNSTPNGAGGLHEQSRSDLAEMLRVLEGFKIAKLKYSSVARHMLTLAQEHDRYAPEGKPFDVIKFFETSRQVSKRIAEDQVPGMWLAADQALAVNDIDLETNLMNIGELRGEKRMPVIIYIKPENPADDTVVDVEVSSDATKEYAQQAGLEFQEIEVDGAPHTSYRFNTEAFVAAFSGEDAEQLRAKISDESTEYAMARQSLWLSLNIEPEQ